MKPIEEIRAALRQKRLQSSRQERGFAGEEICKKWMESNDWVFGDVNDKYTAMNSNLAASYGKRPDFVVTYDNEIVLLDSKYHSTNGLKTFTLSVEELAKYINLEKYLEREFPGHTATVVFMLLPSEDEGKTLMFFCLNDFTKGIVVTLNDSLAIQIDIQERLNTEGLTVRM